MIFEAFALFIFIATCFWYMIFDPRPRKGKKLPGPPNLPFVGSALHIALNPFKRNYEIFEDLSRKYGPLFGLQAGVNYFVVVEEAKLAKEIMASGEWSARFPDTKFIYERSFNKNLGLIFSHGESWKEIRRYTLRTLRQYGFGKGTTMESSLETEVSEFLEEFERLRYENDDDISVNHLFHVATLNITWTMISGIRFSNDDKKFRAFLQVIDQMVKANKPGVSSMSAYPFLRYIPGLTEHDETIRVHKNLQQMFKRMPENLPPLFGKFGDKIFSINKCDLYTKRQYLCKSVVSNGPREILDEKRKKGTYKENPTDFLDAFLKDVDFPTADNSIQDLLTEEQLLMVCIDLFFTSSDTTSAALEFSLLYMILNPRVRVKVQKEIDEVIGTNRLPNLEDRKQMPYLEATLLEVLRYSSINPLAGRSSQKDTYIEGYYIPKNSLIGIMLHAIHFSEKTWGDPYEFRPERFLNAQNEIINKENIMAFGYGTRICIGETLARASFFIFFTSLMQRYNIEQSFRHEKPSLDPITGMTSTPKPFFVVAKRRRL